MVLPAQLERLLLPLPRHLCGATRPSQVPMGSAPCAWLCSQISALDGAALKGCGAKQSLAPHHQLLSSRAVAMGMPGTLQPWLHPLLKAGRGSSCLGFPGMMPVVGGLCPSPAPPAQRVLPRRVLLQRGVPRHPHLRGGPDGQRSLRDVPDGALPRAHQPGPCPLRQQQHHLPLGLPPPAGHLPPRPLHRRAPLRELLG